jgi:tryptophan-rich sensory protein
MEMSQAIATITTSSVSPSAGADMTKVILEDDSALVPPFKDQTASKSFWTYIIISVIILIVCFYMFQQAQSGGINTSRPVGCPNWVDSTGVVYMLVIISGVLLGYSTYRAYTAIVASGAGTTNMLNVVFALQAILMVTWFYYFYMKPSYKTAYYLGIGLTLVSVFQTGMLFYKSADRTAAWSSVPFLLVAGGFTWASMQANSGPSSGASRLTRSTKH